MNDLKLKGPRIQKGLTQQNVADILHITKQQYQLYESEKRELPIHCLKILCEHYKLSADYLLGLPPDLPYPEDTDKEPPESAR